MYIFTLVDETTLLSQNIGNQSSGDAAPHPRTIENLTVLHAGSNYTSLPCIICHMIIEVWILYIAWI